MRYLLSGVAIAALIAAGLPAMAQTNKPQSGATTPSATDSQSGQQMKGKNAGKQRGSQATAQRRSNAANDNMAEELNRQELQRIVQAGTPPASGTTQGTMPQNAPPRAAPTSR